MQIVEKQGAGGNCRFQSVERLAADVINIVTGSKLKYPEGKEDVNVCLAIKQMWEESELAGQIKGAGNGQWMRT